jgi:NitT/TauT family transport system substrate-binding protein
MMGVAEAGRRSILIGGAAALTLGGAASPLRLGIVQSGTVQWIAAVMARHGLDPDLSLVTLANTDAGRVALLAGGVDVAVSDWPFVAVQRAAGRRLVFSPLSSASGAVMVPAGSPIKTLADLRGRKLGVAGGPVDKSWLVVKAAAHKTYGIDLATAASLAFGAPPLLGAKLQQGELDAVLTFWNFAARLEAAGFRAAVSVADAAAMLGLTGAPFLVGYVFNQDWAEAHRAAIDRFLGASRTACTLLASNETDWRTVRPLMDAPDDALFDALRRRFLAGIGHPSPGAQARDAAALFAILLRQGGPKAVGGLTRLPPGLFWPGDDAG